MKYKKEKRKWDYALGLEKQIQYKQQRNGNGLYWRGWIILSDIFKNCSGDQ